MLDSNLLFLDIQQAYIQARKHKSKTCNVKIFEQNLNENLEKLYREILDGTYQISPSIYFIQDKPVKREIFAGTFRDRVVHHLIFDYISPIFEKKFIYDSYSCRKNKGTSRGVQRISKFIRSCSDNYTRDCYILKLDIQGYFMSIDKDILYKKIESGLHNHYGPRLYEQTLGLSRLLSLIHLIIFNDPTQTGIFKGKSSDYDGLPHSKSLFYAKLNCGLPIGNLTSQLFSNIYLNDFDHWIKSSISRLGSCVYYGRYVDDFIIIHPDKDYLLSLIPQISTYLSDNLHLTLHPRKTYLQHYSKGVQFLGAKIGPHRMYSTARTIGNFRIALFQITQTFHSDLSSREIQHILSVINSYLGFLQHTKSFKKRYKMLTTILPPDFWHLFSHDNARTKVFI